MIKAHRLNNYTWAMLSFFWSRRLKGGITYHAILPTYIYDFVVYPWGTTNAFLYLE